MLARNIPHFPTDPALYSEPLLKGFRNIGLAQGAPTFNLPPQRHSKFLEVGKMVIRRNDRILDFAQGRTLAANQGIVATCGPIHDRVVEVVRQVRAGA